MSREPPDEYVEALLKRGFALGEWIGGGAYGSVYRANQTRLNRPVAAKFYDNQFTRGEANEKRFMREAPLLARVQHPAIPYVITTGVLKGPAGSVPFTVMEYISGRTLAHRLEKGPSLEASEIFAVMTPVLSALAAAHEHDVVHRDVKPDNILLSPHGTFLIDFSIGVCLEPEPGLTRATRTGEGLGTVNYASPEQIADAASIDRRTDIYSAGVVLAEMLGARPPIRIDKLTNEIPSVSKEIRAIVLKACAKETDRRFQTADEFLTALDVLIGPRSVGLFDPQLVICPNMSCSGVRFSTGGSYVFGPKITGPTAETFCRNCGSEYIRGCPSCRLPLSEDIASLISKPAKSDPDSLEAHCPRCGTTIFVTPACKTCGSYLRQADIKRDTAAAGCSKCRGKSSITTDPALPGGGTDDDIPF